MRLEMESFLFYSLMASSSTNERETETVMAALRTGTRRIGSKRGERKSTARERKRW